MSVWASSETETKRGSMATPTRKDVNIDDLHFDRFNPRLPEDMERGDEEQVLAWMLRHGDIVDLMASIGATGYSSAEAVLAIPHESGGDQYEVIEGNRRLAAVKLLAAPEKAELRKKLVAETSDDAVERPESIPVLVYDRREDILTYLGYRHITGVKAWGAQEKAKYLRQLYRHYEHLGMEEEKVFQTISQVVATKPYYAKKTLTTLALAEEAKEYAYWDMDRIEPDDVKFSVLGTALSYNPIVEHIGLKDVTDWRLSKYNTNGLKDLFCWLFQSDSEGNSRVRESRELPKLAKVVANEEALQAFRAGHTLEHAAELTDEADEVFRKFVVAALQKLEVAQSQAKRMQAPQESDVQTMRDIWRTARAIGVVLSERLSGSDDDKPF